MRDLKFAASLDIRLEVLNNSLINYTNVRSSTIVKVHSFD